MTTVLLVDDDPMQALVRKTTLERRFKHVLRANDAAEAFCLMQEPAVAARVSLVVSGLHMPGIGGPAFAAELHARVPSVPILVLRSTSDTPANNDDPGVRFLSEPFAAEEMLNTASALVAAASHK